MSLLTQYDDLIRNSNALNTGEEEEFLTFVRSSVRLVRSMSNSEGNVQRLDLELEKLMKENTGLRLKLEQARALVDNESKARKKAEQERARLESQFQLLRQLILETDGVDEGTLKRVKFLEEPSVPQPSQGQGYPNILSPGLMSLRDGLSKPSTSRRRSANMTEESVLDVEDLNLSFDDTANLCDDSRLRLQQSYLGQKAKSERKRSRSVTRIVEGEEEQNGRVRKRERRSRSVGISDKVEVLEITPRMTLTERQDNLQPEPEPIFQRKLEHNLEERTNIKSEKCDGCKKRLKFGKKYLHCVTCKIVIHPECEGDEECHGQNLAPSLTSSPSTVSTNPAIFLSRTPSKREKTNIFASPMLQ